jgi:hypothetical protein
MSELFNDSVVASDTPDKEATEAQIDHPAAQALLGAQAELAVKTSGVLTAYHDRIAEIRDDDKLEDGPYNDQLTPEQRAEIIATRKRAAGQELHKTTVEQYEAAFEQYAHKAEKHAEDLRTSLFGVGEAGSAALTQAISADTAELQRMIALAELTGVETIGKAAFSAAVVRGDQPEVIHRYLQANPEAGALLRAYEQAPTKEWIEAQKSNISRLIQPPTEDQLRSRPQIGAY